MTKLMFKNGDRSRTLKIHPRVMPCDEIVVVQVRGNWRWRLLSLQVVLAAATLLPHPSSASTHPLTPPLTPELTRSTTHTPSLEPGVQAKQAAGSVRKGAEVCTAVRCRAVRRGSVCDGQTRCGGGTVRSYGKGGGTAVPRRETRRRGLGTVPTSDARS